MNLLAQVQQWFTAYSAAKQPPLTQQVLLSEQRLQQLHKYIDTQPHAWLKQQLCASLQSGEQVSRYSGRGIEFDELRRYQPGDDVRDIEWRVSLRRDQLYVKLKHEQRQDRIHIVLDRRATMRFATRDKLKVSQATELSVLSYYAALAAQADTAISLLQPANRMDEYLHMQARTGLAMQLMNEACPPLSTATAPFDWHELFSRLENTLQPGARIFLFSDFEDLAPQHQSALMALSYLHDVTAVRIIDPAEQHLPGLGRVQLQAMNSHELLQLDSRSQQLQQQFDLQQQQRSEQLDGLFRQCGVQMHSCRTDQDSCVFFSIILNRGVA